MTRGRAPVLVLLTALLGCSDGTGPVEEDPDAFPLLLCDVDTAGAIAFSPDWPLWSNGLEKQRHIVLPPGGRIDITDRYRWVFPDGTRFLKRFSIRGPAGDLMHVETRIIRRHEGAWETAAYVWNDEQTDADLVADGSPVAVTVTNEAGRTFVHNVPGSSGCQTCHASSPAFILGFIEVQLNRDDQLALLHGRGIFNAALPDPLDSIAAADAETEWVLGYVTGNCVQCHNGTTEFDLSHDIFLDAAVADTRPSGAVLITPGDPQNSELFLRFQHRDMPPLGVQLRDDEAVNRLRLWIFGLPE